MDIENTIWKNFVGLLKNTLTDPLSDRSDWIRAGFVLGLDLVEPLIIVDQSDITPGSGPWGIGSGKRVFNIPYEIYILTDMEAYTIGEQTYRGPTLRDYFADKIRTLLTDNIKTSIGSLGTGVTDVTLGTAIPLPFYEDLGQYRKQIGVSIEILKT